MRKQAEKHASISEKAGMKNVLMSGNDLKVLLDYQNDSDKAKEAVSICCEWDVTVLNTTIDILTSQQKI